MICRRCFLETRVISRSWFNDDDICTDCQDDEKFCPNYGRARSVELSQVRSGLAMFAGIGLSPEDRVVLRERREARNDE
jgi:hypothetical protein